MGKRRTAAKKQSPFKIGDHVSFYWKTKQGTITAIRASISQFGTAYDVTVQDSAGKLYFIYSGLIDELVDRDSIGGAADGFLQELYSPGSV